MDEISREVYKILSETLGVPLEELHPELPIRSVPSVESIKVLRVILKIEKFFGIEIPDEATFGLQTIGEFDELVQDLCAARRITPAMEPAGGVRTSRG